MSVKLVAQPLNGTAPLARPRRDPWLRLLSEVLELAGPDAEFLHHAERPWASVTFSGSRHSITIAFTGISGVLQGDAFLAALPDHEFAIPGQIVADATISQATHEAGPDARMTVEAELLLIEDN